MYIIPYILILVVILCCFYIERSLRIFLLTQFISRANYGIIVINHKNKIININEKFISYTQPSNPLKRGDVLENYLDGYIEIIDFINELKLGEGREATYTHPKKTTKFILTGYPLQKKVWLSRVFFIELKEYSDSVFKERMYRWSNAVQKGVHDLKTPLSTIHLVTQTLKQKSKHANCSQTSIKQEDFSLLEQEVNRLNHLIRDLARFADLKSPICEEVNIELIIEKTLISFSPHIEHKIQINKLFLVSTPKVFGDSSQLENVFQIVIKNAIESVSLNGSIDIKTSLAYNLNGQSAGIWVDISDTGTGIPDEHLTKVFDPYFTTKFNGTGLGLTIAKRIILEHNGRIEIISNGKSCTTVKIMLPFGNGNIYATKNTCDR